MDKTNKAEVSTIVGDFKIMGKTAMADVSIIVGVKGVMSKLKFKIKFSECKRHLLACKMSSPVALEEILGWCCKPTSYVPYKGTYVLYDGTFGVPDQGQTLDM
jgi:hypothetical protein